MRFFHSWKRLYSLKLSFFFKGGRSLTKLVEIRKVCKDNCSISKLMWWVSWTTSIVKFATWSTISIAMWWDFSFSLYCFELTVKKDDLPSCLVKVQQFEFDARNIRCKYWITIFDVMAIIISLSICLIESFITEKSINDLL